MTNTGQPDDENALPEMWRTAALEDKDRLLAIFRSVADKTLTSISARFEFQDNGGIRAFALPPGNDVGFEPSLEPNRMSPASMTEWIEMTDGCRRAVESWAEARLIAAETGEGSQAGKGKAGRI